MKTSFWAIILLLLTSCQGSEKCDRLMQLADSLIENTNDFATASTLIFDSIDTQTDKLSHRQLMRHKLLQLKVRNKQDRLTEADTAFTLVADYYRRHGMEIHYVGNPTVDEVEDFQSRHLAETREDFAAASGLPADRAYIAILPGSRKQEIGYNLRRICQAARRLAAQGYLLLVACTPDIDESVYLSNIPEDMLRDGSVRLLTGRTYSILRYSRSAIVTSGTATLETALFRVPQVVCYYIPAGRMVSVLRKAMLKVRFISLVNLIAGEEVVRELVAGDMTPDNVRAEIEKITPDGEARSAMLRGYELVIDKLGAAGAPAIAAREIVGCLQRHIEQQSGVRDI